MLRQFERVWESLREAIGNCPAKEWKSGDTAVRIPVRQACHIIGAVEMYAGEGPFVPDRKLGLPIGDFNTDIPQSELPDKQQVLDYLEETCKQADAWLHGMGDSRLLSSQRSNRHTGDTFLERAVYMLRHSQHHLGEMNAELKSRGLSPASWQ